MKKTTITTTATIYVHACEDLAIGPKGFKEEVEFRAEELQADNDHLSEWLSCNRGLTSAEIFRLSKEERAELRQRYEEQCLEDAEEELLEDSWSKHEVEVEIEVES